MAKLSLKIVTPNRIMYDGEADLVIMRTKTGDVGIMNGHQPMVTALDYGVVKIQNSGEEDKLAAVFGGFAKINKNGMTILTDIAEWNDEIDPERAERARKRALNRIQNPDPTIDMLRAELDLKKAIIRLNLRPPKKHNK